MLRGWCENLRGDRVPRALFLRDGGRRNLGATEDKMYLLSTYLVLKEKREGCVRKV